MERGLRSPLTMSAQSGGHLVNVLSVSGAGRGRARRPRKHSHAEPGRDGFFDRATRDAQDRFIFMNPICQYAASASRMKSPATSSWRHPTPPCSAFECHRAGPKSKPGAQFCSGVVVNLARPTGFELVCRPAGFAARESLPKVDLPIR